MAAERRSNADDIIFQGELNKQSLYLKQFKKAWIVLRNDGNLYCYKTESMKNKPTEIIDVAYYKSIEANNKNLFTLYDPNDNIDKHKRFKSADSSMITLWIEILSPIIKTKNGKLTNDDPPKFIHKVDQQKITCPDILQSRDTKNPFNCPIYAKMMKNNQYTQKNYNHMLQYQHFENEFKQKPKCNDPNLCKGYNRCINGAPEYKEKYLESIVLLPGKMRVWGSLEWLVISIVTYCTHTPQAEKCL